MNPPCPYCQKELPNVPKRKTPCPFCKKPILVRKTPDLEPGFKLLTETDALILRYYEQFNVTLAEMQEAKKSLPKGPIDWDAGDVLWSVLSKRVQAAMREWASNKDADGPLAKLQFLHSQMAWFAFQEGRDPTRIRQEAARMGLLIWKLQVKQGWLDADATRLVITSAGHMSCEACQKAADQEFTIDEALKQNPLPVKGCTHDQKDRPVGWCRCSYGIVAT